MFLYIFLSCIWMAESTELQLLENDEAAPFQVILLVNERTVEQTGQHIWDFAATGVILNEQWVLTSIGLDRLSEFHSSSLEKIKVIAGDKNFLENEVDISSRYRQTLLVCERKEVKNFMLLKVNGKFHIDGTNIQRVQLPKTYVEGVETLENGFPSKNDNCHVWGWKMGSMVPIGEVQKVGKVKITRLGHMEPNQYIGVKGTSSPMNKFIKSIKKNECLAGECTNMKIVGFPLMCRNQNDELILMGVGDWNSDWEWTDNKHAFDRVSTYIHDLRKTMQRSTPELYLYQGVEGQPKKFSFQAIVKVAYQGNDNEFVQKCQGAIVSRNKVLTAASCFDNNDKENRVARVAVVVGVTDLRTQGAQLNARSWSQYNENDLEHGSRSQEREKYDADDDFDFYNIGIIELERDLNLGKHVTIVSLATTTNELNGCTVSSWEKKDQGNHPIISAASKWGKKGPEYHPIIRYRHVELLESLRCNSPMLKPNVLEKFFNEHLCVKEREDREWPSIEEGAPMTCYVGGNVKSVSLVGIASFAANPGDLSLERFGSEQGPKIYTSVPAHSRWINAKIQE